MELTVLDSAGLFDWGCNSGYRLGGLLIVRMKKLLELAARLIIMESLRAAN